MGNNTAFPHELPGFAGQQRAYNAINQWIGYGQGQPGLFAYDHNGNPTKYKGDTLTYDQENNLTSYRKAADLQPCFTAGYRSDGLRAWKEVNGQRTYFLYVGATLLCELDGTDGAVTSYHTWGPTGLLNRTNLQTNREIWYLFDAQGNVAQRLDAAGRVVSADRYDAWGNLVATRGEVSDPYGYHAQDGYYTDHETGLILCGERYYDPQAGRFLTQDPSGLAGGKNLYAYCVNAPSYLTDPTGNSPTIITALVGGGIGAVGGGLVGGGVQAWHCWRSGNWDWKAIGGAAGRGAIVGGITGFGAGLAGPAGAALGAKLGLGAVGSAVVAGAVGGMVGDAIGQGVSMAAGRQQKFSYWELAGAGVFGGAMGGVGEVLPGLMLKYMTRQSARTVDELGIDAFTRPQQKALVKKPQLEAPYRGNRIDVMTREKVKMSWYFNKMRPMQSNYSKGPDFVDKLTGRWYDMTTPEQWARHVQIYGPNGTLLPTR